MSRCQHPGWDETERVFAPGPCRVESTGMPTTTLERLAFGVTSIIYRCRACGFTRTLEVLGDARIPKSEARP